MKRIVLLTLGVAVATLLCLGQNKNQFKIDTPLYFYTANMVNIQKTDNIVFTIDTNHIITVPRGWQFMIVIKDNKVWAIDSLLRDYSYPNNWQ
jgi:hypothetical protein